MQIPEQIILLAQKLREGTISPAEMMQLNEWYNSFEDHAVEYQLEHGESANEIAHNIRQRITRSISNNNTRKKKHWRKWAVAAAAILCISTAAYFLWDQGTAKPIAASPAKKPLQKDDIAPGGNKAILTLADGSTITLDSAANGQLTQQDNISITKTEDGKLTYQIDGKTITEDDEAFYNTISTPRGGQYQVTLSDGSKVWLNAASSIRFPVRFMGTERKVTITGEAYFEVEKDAARPFRVNAAGSEVEVLGTAFDVNAYDDENSIKTTLVHGSVKIKAAASGNTAFLTPGQQSGIAGGKIDVRNDADIEEVLAWKNGRFQFNHTDIRSILRQISRWYDVDVEYAANVDMSFSGQLTKDEYVSKVFDMLALTGEVKFRIAGRKIIVTPKTIAP